MKIVAGIKSADRVKSREEQKRKTYEDFNWSLLITNSTLSKLTVVQLKLYLDKNELSKAGIKADKIERIKAHFYLI